MASPREKVARALAAPHPVDDVTYAKTDIALEALGLNGENVLVPRKSLELLYDCASSYDRRIPQDGHDDWAEPIRAALEATPEEE